MASGEAGRWVRVGGFFMRRSVLITLAVLVVLFAAYTLAGFFLVPRLVAGYVPRYVEQQLKRRAEIGEIRVNPLLWKVDIRNFRLTEADGRPLLGFDRLFVDFELAKSILRAAWTFAEIRLEAPRVDAVIYPDGRMNIAQLLDDLPKSEPAKEPSAPRRMLVQHAVVQQGLVSFTDQSGRTPQKAGVQPIDVELHDITTLPERRGPYTIAATLTGGGVVGWDGQVSLVPVASTGCFDLRGFPLATAWRFVQDYVAVAEPKGAIEANLRYDFAYRDGATSLKVSDVKVGVTGLILTERASKAPLLALDEVSVVGVSGDVIAGQLTVPEIAVKRGRVAATLARDGTVNWQRLVTTPASPAQTAAPKPDAPAAETRPWQVAVAKVRVDDIALAVVDESRAAPLAVDIAGLNLGLSARLESGPSGLAGVADHLGLTLARVAVRSESKTPLVSLERIAVDGGRIDLGARQVAISRVAVNGGATTVVRDASGALPMLATLQPADPSKPTQATTPAKAAPGAEAPLAAKATPAAKAAPRAKAPPTKAAPEEKSWSVALDRLELADHRVAITDRGITPAVELGLADLKASVRDVRTDGKKPWPFDASFRVVQGGRFTAKGRVAPDGRTADATLTLTQLALTPAQPYVARSADVVLRSGDVSSTGKLTYRAGADGPSVTYTGSADVERLAVMEAGIKDPVLAWKSLHAETIRFGLRPDQLEIDEVRVGDLDGRLVIFQDKTINVAKLMKPGPTAQTSAPAPSALPTTATGREPSPAFPMSIARVRLDNSSMNFADLSLVLPFATRIHSFNGVVAGLGSDPNGRATVKLDGQVDEFGSVKVDGSMAALQPKVFTDIAVIFRNVPMSTLSPYSATFAGRRIEAGTMNLDLEYKVDHGELQGDNKVVLERMKLGERVESPGAMKLPLDLAIAILTDSDGRINVAVPVRGNVDHPEFSYGHVLWEALITVIKKVATAPFRALGALFGGSGEEKLEAIAFEPGRDVVAPPERQKLKRVGDVLGKRPQLKITVHGGYDAKLDGEALRGLHVRQELARRLDVKLKPGEDPGPVAFDDVKTQRALEAMMRERGADKAVEGATAQYEKSSGKKADRANRMLALVGRGAGDRALYEAFYRQLVETAPLAESELTELAKRRGEATVRALSETASAVAARVEAGSTEAAGGAERKGIPSRLELGAVGS
jgi:uncharacterized protein involved in outer membrane biogenesis